MHIMPLLLTKITRMYNHLYFISLNTMELYSTIKRHRLTDWICKQNVEICCIQETYLSDKDRHYLRLKV